MSNRGRILDRERHAFPPPRASLLFLLLVSLALPPALFGHRAEDRSAIDCTGFISAMIFGQNRLFAPGNGQQAQRVSDAQDGPDGWSHGGDIRNTRLAVDVSTSGLGAGWSGGGRIAFDLFGGFTETRSGHAGAPGRSRGWTTRTTTISTRAKRRKGMINPMPRIDAGAPEFGVEWRVARTQQWRETQPDGASAERARTGCQLALGTVLHP